jgi:hypothetical protein
LGLGHSGLDRPGRRWLVRIRTLSATGSCWSRLEAGAFA